MNRTIAGLTAATAMAVAVLAGGLRPDAWTSGDSGLKYIAAHDVVAHWERPLRVDLPRVGGEVQPWVDHMTWVHGSHAHILQTPIFPILTAPFIAAFGRRGTMVLPGVAFVLLLPLAFALARRAAPRTPLWAVIVAATLASPVFFYGLEFWEHAPAIALLAWATLLVTQERPRLQLAGTMVAFATLLRPEAAWYGVALGLVWLRPRQILTFAAAGAAPLALFAVVNLVENGTLVGPHVTLAMGTVFSAWSREHAARFVTWLGLTSPLVLGGLLVAGLAHASALAALGSRQILALAGALSVAVAGAFGLAGDDALWRAWPIGLVVLLPAASDTPLRRRLLVVLGLTSLLVWLTSPHDGGAQWGPRFLLIAAPAMSVLAALALTDASAAGRRRILRIGLVAALVAVGAWNTRTAYLRLRGVKEVHSTLVHRVAEFAPTGGYVVTNAWWLNQVAASLRGTRTFLTSETSDGIPTMLPALERSGVSRVTLAWSDDRGEPGPLDGLLHGTCWQETARTTMLERRLTLVAAECRR